MPRPRTVTPDKGTSTEELKEFQRKLLENLPLWLSYRGLLQKDIAAALKTSEGQISRWFSGEIQMTIGRLRQIAAVLKTPAGDLLSPPPQDGLGQRVEETLELMDALTPEEWDAVLNNARMIRKLKGK